MEYDLEKRENGLYYQVKYQDLELMQDNRDDTDLLQNSAAGAYDES